MADVADLIMRASVQGGQQTVTTLDQIDASAKRAERSTDSFSAGSARLSQQMVQADKAMKQASMAGLGLSRQFADVGVSLAGGINPLMVLIQQGPQVADQLSMMQQQGVGLSSAFRSMGGQVAGLLRLLAPVAVAVGVAAAAFALFEREIDSNTKHATTWGDTFKATVKVVGDLIMDGPIGTGLKWLAGAFGATLDAIVDGVMWFADKVVGHFGAAYQLVVKNWQRLPEVFGVIVQGAANIAIDALEGLVNKAIDGVNFILKAAGKAALDHINLPEIKLANTKLAAEYKDLAKTIEGDFRKGRESVADRIAKQADKEFEARQKVKKATKEHADEVDKLAKAYERLKAAVQSALESLETPQERALRVAHERMVTLRKGLDANIISADQFREAIDRMFPAIVNATDAQKALSVELQSTPADIEIATERTEDWAEAMYDLADAIGYAADALQRGDLAGALNGAAAALKSMGGPAGLTASLGQLGAIAALSQAINPSIAKVLGMDAKQQKAAGNFGLLGALVVGKESNHGAGYDLTTGAFSGNKRNAETEAAAKGAAEAIRDAQESLRDSGIILTTTVRGLVIGSRDLSQIYLTNGQTITSAVGDVAAAAEAAVRGVLQGATYVSDAQRTLVEGMVAAGKGFDDITEALQTYAAAQKISGGIADQILQLTDPKAFDLQSVTRDIAAQREAYGKLATEGYLTAEQLSGINEQLTTLEGLRLDDVMKRYTESVETAAAANDNATAISRQRLAMEAEIARLRGQDAVATGIEQALTLDQLPEALHATQQLLWAEQKLAEERKLAKEAADLAAETAREQAAEAQRKTEATKAAMIQAANDNLATARSAAIDAYQRERAELEATENALRATAERFKAFRRELDFGSIAGRDPVSQLAATRREFNRLNAMDASNPERVANLQAVSQAFLEASQAASPTQKAFDRDLNAARRATEATQVAAEEGAEVAKAQLAAQLAMVSELGLVNTNIVTLAAAITAFKSATSAVTAATNPANDAINVASYGALNPDLAANWNSGGVLRSMGGTLDEALLAHWRITGQFEGRAFASGGMHPGGIRMVGEDGPELEVTGPSRIFSARETAGMLGGDNSAVVAELQATRAELGRVRDELSSIKRDVREMANISAAVTRGGTSVSTKEAA